MRIIIETNPDIENPEKVVFEELRKTCVLGLNHFKIFVEGTELRYEQ